MNRERQEAAEEIERQIEGLERTLAALQNFHTIVAHAETKEDVVRMLYTIYRSSGISKELQKEWIKFIDHVVLSDILEKEE